MAVPLPNAITVGDAGADRGAEPLDIEEVTWNPRGRDIPLLRLHRSVAGRTSLCIVIDPDGDVVQKNLEDEEIIPVNRVSPRPLENQPLYVMSPAVSREQLQRLRYKCRVLAGTSRRRCWPPSGTANCNLGLRRPRSRAFLRATCAIKKDDPSRLFPGAGLEGVCEGWRRWRRRGLDLRGASA